MSKLILGKNRSKEPSTLKPFAGNSPQWGERSCYILMAYAKYAYGDPDAEPKFREVSRLVQTNGSTQEHWGFIVANEWKFICADIRDIDTCIKDLTIVGLNGYVKVRTMERYYELTREVKSGKRFTFR